MGSRYGYLGGPSFKYLNPGERLMTNKSKEELEKEERIRTYNREIAKDASWLCEFFQEVNLSPADKSSFIKYLVLNAAK